MEKYSVRFLFAYKINFEYKKNNTRFRLMQTDALFVLNMTQHFVSFVITYVVNKVTIK